MVNRLGQQLGNYRLTRLLGQGGFAEVYLGEHVLLGTTIAIKVLHTQVVPEDMTQFQQEARILASLKHPHIVRILDFGIEERTPYLMMDYAQGGTLRTRHPKGTVLPIPTAVEYVKQIAQALQYAHERKIVHRDIKPENMPISERNEILLSDFGIALVTQSSRYQSTQDMAGTMAYSAPEQIQGKSRPASDQYALGIVVYEWLSGDRPFHGSFTELVGQHLTVPPPPLRAKLPTISPDVEHVILTALAKRPEDRFDSIRTFANALEQASQGNLPTERARSVPLSSPLSPSPAPQPMLVRNSAPTTPPGIQIAPRGAKAGSLQPTVAGRSPLSPSVFSSAHPRRKLRWIVLLVGVIGIIIAASGLVFLTSSSSKSNSGSTSTSNISITPGGTIPSAFVVKPGMVWQGTLRTCGNPAVCGAELKILIIDPSGNFTGTWANDFSSSNGTNYTDVENVQGNITSNHISWTGTGRIKGNSILPNAHHEGQINSDGHIHGDSQNDSFDLDLVQTIPNIVGTWQGTKRECGGRPNCNYKVVVISQDGGHFEAEVCYNVRDTDFSPQSGDTWRGCANASGSIDSSGHLSWTTKPPFEGGDNVYTDDNCLLSGDTITGGAGIVLHKIS